MLLLHGHRAPLERSPKAGGGYKHLAAPRPIHNYTITGIEASLLLPFQGYTDSLVVVCKIVILTESLKLPNNHLYSQ